jgi:hypothetical protein
VNKIRGKKAPIFILKNNSGNVYNNNSKRLDPCFLKRGTTGNRPTKIPKIRHD